MTTTSRNVRIDDHLWLAAQHAASQRGETVTDVIRCSLVEYVSESPERAAAMNELVNWAVQRFQKKPNSREELTEALRAGLQAFNCQPHQLTTESRESVLNYARGYLGH